jgi:hypothetical protein
VRGRILDWICSAICEETAHGSGRATLDGLGHLLQDLLCRSFIRLDFCFIFAPCGYDEPEIRRPEDPQFVSGMLTGIVHIDWTVCCLFLYAVFLVGIATSESACDLLYVSALPLMG